MTKRLTHEDLLQLMTKQARWCVSVYMPTHRSLPEVAQDPIRFKNLLKEAAKECEAKGLSQPDREALLKPAQSLLDDSIFWRYQSDGLAVFLAADDFRNYRLPISFDEFSIVGERFHVKPLLPLLGSDERFFVLALSQNAVRLVEGTRFGASEVELENAPGSLAEITGDYDFEAQLQFHTGSRQVGDARAAVFHGHGGADNDVKTRISEYFRRIDHALQATLRDEQAPLVLAGVESLFPIYRSVNSYGQLLEGGISGNPETLHAEDLCQRAREIVTPVFRAARGEAEERFHALAGTGRTSSDLKEVVMAADDGRVETLIAGVGSQVWGRFEREKRSVVVHEQYEPDDIDLLDLSAVRTVMNGGTVFSADSDATPGAGPIAAIYRY